MTTFKRAVSWAEHMEPDEFIRDHLGYEGDLIPVRLVADLLSILSYRKASFGDSLTITENWANKETDE